MRNVVGVSNMRIFSNYGTYLLRVTVLEFLDRHYNVRVVLGYQDCPYGGCLIGVIM